MIKKIITSAVFFSLILASAGTALAHTPVCSCYDLGDGKIVCEGGFSDGSSARGVKIRVVDEEGNVLVKGKMDEFSEFEFKKPEEKPFTIIFDAGPGHKVKIPGRDLE